MKFCRVLHAALIAPAAAACYTGADATVAIAVERDSAGISIVTNDLARLATSCTVSPAPTVVIGSADGGEAYELHRVFGATQLSDGRIALVNQGTQQLRFYDRAGKYLQSSGRAGDGPGEFRRAFLMWNRPGDTLLVGNYVPWELHVFAPDGKFVRTVGPTPQYYNNPDEAFVLDDGRLIVADEVRATARRSSEFTVQHLNVLLHNADGTRADSIGVFPRGRWGQVDPSPTNVTWISPFFESFARMAGGGNRFIIGHSATPELRVYTIDSIPHLTSLIRFTTGDRSITSADVAAEKERLQERYKDVPPERAAELVAPLISDKRPVADVFPAFAGVILARDGRLWMREYTKPGAPPGAAWVAFAPNGRATCRAEFPGGVEVWEIGADYLLGTRADSLGVLQVVRHTMR